MPNKPKPPPKGWLWSQDAADYIGVHVVTLHRWRRDGTGPKSVLHGRRRYAYKISDLDAWMNGDTADDQPHRARAAA
ncbi:helix-turn-helix domain-containing protein [Streptomyces sp. NPDC007251]|uniref:helix-turn-helix transcriptional regulator n=1 Tax=Streptomyces sp. NPDC007251 TaxID=3154483 RepID=UPI0033FFF914